MSTVTSRRPSLLLVLQAAVATAELSTVLPLRRRTMHPDCLLLQKHGVKSPRLSPTVAATNTKAADYKAIMSLVDERAAREEHVVKIDDDSEMEVDDEEELDVQSGHTGNSTFPNEADALSLCSDDSELSVGQESGIGASDSHQEQRSLLDNVGEVISLCAPSAFSFVTTSGDCSDARSTASTDDGPCQAESDKPTSAPKGFVSVEGEKFALLNPLRAPVRIPPPQSNSSTFQEEFLRKSQLYAEELMKQQVQFMAAARASAFSLRGASTTVASPPTNHHHPEVPNFAGIHSHFSAISKMSQLGAAAAAAAAAAAVANNQPGATSCSRNKALARLTALGVMNPQSDESLSVSSLNQLQAQMQARMPFMDNNNFNEPSLKFSIDNILKADFGRRITDSFYKRDGSAAALNANNDGRPSSHSFSMQCARAAATKAMDLTSLMSSVPASAGTLNFSNTLANICTNSNDSNSTAVSSDIVKSPSVGQVRSSSPASANQGNASLLDAGESGEESKKDDAANSTSTTSSSGTGASGSGPIVWPAWVYCTRYSDRPSSGPRTRKPKKAASEKGASPTANEDKRPRTAFSGSQLARLKHEFTENRYLTEKRRQQLSGELGLNEAQIKIWFQNKRAKLKKSSGTKNPLALQLMAQGLYNHSTVPLTREEEELQELQERENAAAAAAAVTASTAGTVST